MRITILDLQIEDITWFAIDQDKHIAAFMAGGQGNVPEFICRSKEETELLEDFFLNTCPEFTKGKITGDFSTDCQMHEDCINLTNRGIYVYDICYDDYDQYNLIATPQTKLTFDKLPENIQNILADHVVDFKFSKDKKLIVPHAY